MLGIELRSSWLLVWGYLQSGPPWSPQHESRYRYCGAISSLHCLIVGAFMVAIFCLSGEEELVGMLGRRPWMVRLCGGLYGGQRCNDGGPSSWLCGSEGEGYQVILVLSWLWRWRLAGLDLEVWYCRWWSPLTRWVDNVDSTGGTCEGQSESSMLWCRRRRHLQVSLPSWGHCCGSPHGSRAPEWKA